MKKIFISTVILFLVVAPYTVSAQDPITLIIKEGVKKVIVAVDLKIQRLQNKTIWLQNVQKVVENELSKLRLQEIASWVEKQHTLYKDYYDELRKVKAVITYYHNIKAITNRQIQLVKEYKQAIALFKQDQHFSVDEIKYMEQVYAGILEASLRNLDEVLLVVQSFSTQMSDASRLEIIRRAVDRIEENYSDLKTFNSENALLSLARAKDEKEITWVKNLYGLQ
jgi:hypothetical protein